MTLTPTCYAPGATVSITVSETDTPARIRSFYRKNFPIIPEHFLKILSRAVLLPCRETPSPKGV